MGHIQCQLKSVASVQFDQNWTDKCRIKRFIYFIHLFIFPITSTACSLAFFKVTRIFDLSDKKR